MRGSVARGAADTEVDAVGVERDERPELLRDDERRVVGQHHPAGTHAVSSTSRPATWAIITAGAELAIPGMLWCSAIQ